MAEATKPERRRRYSAERRRAEIARAAAALFGERGYGRTRLDDIAAAAGVTKPIIYRHFGSKKALYMALLEQHEADLPRFFVGAEPGEPAEDLLRSILDRWLDYVRLNSHAWLMLFRDSSGDEEIRALRRRVSLRAREVLAGFLSSRASTAADSELIEPTAEVLRSGLVGLALWWIDRPDVPKQIPLDVAVSFAAATVASRTPAPGARID